MYAYGFRNVQGLAWHASGALLATEHGPTALPNEAGRFGLDEPNVVRVGVNDGWPHLAGHGSEPRFNAPLAVWISAIAPAGIAASGDTLYIGALRGRQLRRIEVDVLADLPEAITVGCGDALFPGAFGQVRAVRGHPDGSIDFTTSNRDGRGGPADGDDNVLRIGVVTP
ncbi:MAG TPA: PQQ-dependent sugar dehydrogenase [Gemmatimonadales bacterium]